MATPGWPDPRLLALFAVGAVVMRGAGCTINDVIDRHVDARVARTRDRPLPSGEVSVTQAVAFAITLSLIGFLVLIQFNMVTIGIGVASLALVVVYPLAKRVTHWPQAVLGLTFNWGVLVGWSAVTAGLDAAALTLYGGAVCWTVAYDTIYAHQDKTDDRAVGVKSTALLFGAATHRWLLIFFGAALALAAASGWLANLAWPFYAGLVATAAHFGWQVRTLDIDDPHTCSRLFRSNQYAGLLIFLAIVLGNVAGGG